MSLPLARCRCDSHALCELLLLDHTESHLLSTDQCAVILPELDCASGDCQAHNCAALHALHCWQTCAVVPSVTITCEYTH